jgi:hypothetical protein
MDPCQASRLRHSQYGLVPLLPARNPKFLPKPLFRLLPVRLRLDYLLFASPCQAEQTLSPIFSPLDLNPISSAAGPVSVSA